MIDHILLRFFGWIDKLNEKLNSVLTFDFPKPKKKTHRKKCKSCHCRCHCKDEFHSHHWDGDLCICEDCKCGKKLKKR